MSDLISRQALCEYALNQKDKSITPNDIKLLPSAQPETHEERTETHSCDLIDRQAAIEAMEDVDWHHINSNGQLVHGANSKEDEPLYKAEDVYKVLNDVPSAQPEHTSNNDCNGCKFVGCYDTDFPCANCIRKNKDYYAPEGRTDEAR